ncbi:hypothetical protein L1987_74703 [Smallanthus sonchifolius]|uniref:Uncharacterized protein n=1 Tax=Smallanthus sonchifolius TaxID=185202 RepID=A0ACB9A2P2_9ASTR|nr:hypothetical protein L1987_74703 [Smallanthus sonchifolius]
MLRTKKREIKAWKKKKIVIGHFTANRAIYLPSNYVVVVKRLDVELNQEDRSLYTRRRSEETDLRITEGIETEPSDHRSNPRHHLLLLPCFHLPLLRMKHPDRRSNPSELGPEEIRDEGAVKKLSIRRR